MLADFHAPPQALTSALRTPSLSHRRLAISSRSSLQPLRILAITLHLLRSAPTSRLQTKSGSTPSTPSARPKVSRPSRTRRSRSSSISWRRSGLTLYVVFRCSVPAHPASSQLWRSFGLAIALYCALRKPTLTYIHYPLLIQSNTPLRPLAVQGNPQEALTRHGGVRLRHLRRRRVRELERHRLLRWLQLGCASR